jgi:putative transposase
MNYQLISEVAGKADGNHTVVQCCRVLEVSRAGYYQHQQRATQTEESVEMIQVKAAFADSGSTYGSRRLCRALSAKGIRMGRYKVRRIMRQTQCRPVWKRQFIHTTDSKHLLPVADNILNRQFEPDQPDQAWVSDITYVRTRQGWLYLAVVMDLYARKIIGWAMAPHMQTSLISAALSKALQLRRITPGLILHSDRGSQYASSEYQTFLSQHGIVCSMSRRANCWDNAVMERFFLNLKMERVWQRDYANHAEAERDIVDYIVGFYNCTRLHSTLGYLSPAEYEQLNSEKKPCEVSVLT